MVIQVTEASQAGEARRLAVACAEKLRFDERERGAVAIVVTEMATNLVKHAQKGVIVLQTFPHNGSQGLRVLGLDKGPGISDLGSALQDGYSTSGTYGNGLGAIKRMSQAFDIHSTHGTGTGILADFWAPGKTHADESSMHAEAISLPIKGEQVCGDGWGKKSTASSAMFMVVDGLGHGIAAAEAAREAERIFKDSTSESPTTILRDTHDALKKTRGAAMAIAVLNLEKQIVTFAGVGNIAAHIVSPLKSRGLASHNGTLGHQLYKIQEFTFPWDSNSLLVMHSDGLNTRWDLSTYPGIWNKHPGLISALLFRDFSRERDDVTVLVAKNRN